MVSNLTVKLRRNSYYCKKHRFESNCALCPRTKFTKPEQVSSEINFVYSIANWLRGANSKETKIHMYGYETNDKDFWKTEKKSTLEMGAPRFRNLQSSQHQNFSRILGSDCNYICTRAKLFHCEEEPKYGILLLKYLSIFMCVFIIGMLAYLKWSGWKGNRVHPIQIE